MGNYQGLKKEETRNEYGKDIHYTSWPVGKIPKEFQRPELDQLTELGYEWDDPRDVVDMFEEKVAKFAGSKYACSIDSCSNGLYLAMKYHLPWLLIILVTLVRCLKGQQHFQQLEQTQDRYLQ